MHCNVTDHPSEEWTAQQIREAFPWEAPKYLIRDRDPIFGGAVVTLTKDMGIEEVVTAPRSPWQNPYVERLIGSIRQHPRLAMARKGRSSNGGDQQAFVAVGNRR
jgi:putative transposase